MKTHLSLNLVLIKIRMISVLSLSAIVSQAHFIRSSTFERCLKFLGLKLSMKNFAIKLLKVSVKYIKIKLLIGKFVLTTSTILLQKKGSWLVVIITLYLWTRKIEILDIIYQEFHTIFLPILLRLVKNKNTLSIITTTHIIQIFML